jgi:uncharacterized protein (DUF2384 family)
MSGDSKTRFEESSGNVFADMGLENADELLLNVTNEIRMAALNEILYAVVEQPEEWMTTPNVQFGGRRPIDLVGTEEESKVIDLLYAVDGGMA